MRLSRRRWLDLAAGVAALPALSRTAWSQAYPARPVRFMVGFPAGNAPDIIARLIGQALSERLGQQFVIENRPGAGSNIATEAALSAPADGYTLLMIVLTNVLNATLYANLKFNFMHDIAPVAGIADAPYLVVVNPSLPAKTVPEFIAYAKANPGKVYFASGGNGTSSHIFGELLKMMAGIDLVHVPYRGSFMPDLLSGQVQMTINPIPQAMEYVTNGKLRALAVTTAKRLPALPDIPAMNEFVPGYEATGWYGLCVPRGHAGGDRQHAQRGDQCRARRPQAEGAACQHGRRAVDHDAGRIRKIRHRRLREVGQGDQVCRHQGGVTSVMPALVAGIHDFLWAMPRRRGWPGRKRVHARLTTRYARP